MLGLAVLPAVAQENPLHAARHRRKHAELKASPAAEQGKKTFQGSCAFCHGEDATGGRGPDLVPAKSRTPLNKLYNNAK